ncbi:hypothetical protein [Gilvibacter sp.]|uniref:hypothetical protein n=1 Tax=Gilvibacter sp. TaxID=2729997 RepID=UPI0025BA43BA|nr:hypothetical protein [Gilvibacter sp.]NQX76882.1 hypothetical protein [Gilvibacter sp.]
MLARILIYTFLFAGYFEFLTGGVDLQLYAGVLITLLGLLQCELTKQYVYQLFGLGLLCWVIYSYEIYIPYNDYANLKARKLIVLMIFAFFSAKLLLKQKSLEPFVKGLLSCCLLVFLLAVGSVFGLSAKIQNNAIWLSRATGFFIILNIFAYLKNKNIIHLIVCAVAAGTILLLNKWGPILSLAMLWYFFFYQRLRATSLYLFYFISLCLFIIAYVKFPEIDSSGRDVLFGIVLSNITENYFGYGLGYFSTLTHHRYPHNIFTEIFLEMGVVFLALFIVFIVRFFNTLSTYVRKLESEELILASLMLYSFFNTQFSGDLSSPKMFYIFVIYFMIKYKRPAKQKAAAPRVGSVTES